jgi:hypothetical protein
MMNHNTRAIARPRPGAARPAAVAVAAAFLSVLAAGCGAGSGGAPHAGGSADPPSAVSYSRCIRAHGVPDFPDPDSGGQLQKITNAAQQLGVGDSVFSAATAACQDLWPYQPPTQAQQRQQLTDDLKLARCMRSHGVPGFPDPTVGTGGQVEFVISSQAGFSPYSAPIKAKAVACERTLGATGPLPSVTVSP